MPMKLSEKKPDGRRLCNVVLGYRTDRFSIKDARLRIRVSTGELAWHYVGGSYLANDKDRWAYAT